MAHSKMTKRGRSHYVESWNPSAKNFINKCVLCGDEGYSPSIDEEGFLIENGNKNFKHYAIHAELTKTLTPLALDELGRCEVCARTMDKKEN